MSDEATIALVLLGLGVGAALGWHCRMERRGGAARATAAASVPAKPGMDAAGIEVAPHVHGAASACGCGG